MNLLKNLHSQVIFINILPDDIIKYILSFCEYTNKINYIISCKNNVKLFKVIDCLNVGYAYHIDEINKYSNITKFTNLHKIGIDEKTRISKNDLLNMKKLKHIEISDRMDLMQNISDIANDTISLTLCYTIFAKQTINITPINTLQSLCISGLNINTNLTGFINLKKIKLLSMKDIDILFPINLQEIYLYGTTISHKNNVNELSNLKILNFLFTSHIENIDTEKLKKLEHLMLSYNDINAENFSVDKITKLTNLTYLNIPSFHDSILPFLSNLKNIDVYGEDDINFRNVENLKKITLTGTKTAYNIHSNVETINLSHSRSRILDFPKLQNLTDLDLSDSMGTTDEDIKNLYSIKKLQLQCNHKITDNGIKNLTNLELLSLHHNNLITNEGIKNLFNLTDITLNKSNITDDGIKNLTKLTHIRGVDSRKISEETLLKLPKLKYTTYYQY